MSHFRNRPDLQSIFSCFITAGGEIDCILEESLVFFTGSSTIPPLGFKKQPKIVVLEDLSGAYQLLQRVHLNCVYQLVM